MDEDIGAAVELFVYDLTKGMARMMSQMLLGECCCLCVLTAVWGVSNPVSQVKYNKVWDKIEAFVAVMSVDLGGTMTYSVNW